MARRLAPRTADGPLSANNDARFTRHLIFSNTLAVVAEREPRRWLRESYSSNVEEVGVGDVVCCRGSAHGSASEGERGAEPIADADAAL